MTPRLISSHHSCRELIPFSGVALQMFPSQKTGEHLTCFLLWLKTVGIHWAHTLLYFNLSVMIVRTLRTLSDIGGNGFFCTSSVLHNESNNQLDDVIGKVFFYLRHFPLSFKETHLSLKRLCPALTLATVMHNLQYICDVLG